MSDRERDPKAGISPKEQPQPVVGRDVPKPQRVRREDRRRRSGVAPAGEDVDDHIG